MGTPTRRISVDVVDLVLGTNYIIGSERIGDSGWIRILRSVLVHFGNGKDISGFSPIRLDPAFPAWPSIVEGKTEIFTNCGPIEKAQVASLVNCNNVNDTLYFVKGVGLAVFSCEIGSKGTASGEGAFLSKASLTKSSLDDFLFRIKNAGLDDRLRANKWENILTALAGLAARDAQAKQRRAEEANERRRIVGEINSRVGL